MSTSSSSRKREPIPPPTELPNGRKVYTVGGKPFETLPQYSLHKVVGFGAYGVVCSATDSATGKKVAIKKCHDVHRDAFEAKRILREVQLLKFMSHENILGLKQFYLSGDTPATANVAYMVTELLDTDLNTVIRSRQVVTTDHLKYFVYQILRGLKFVHSADVMHRDLKPANLLVNINCDLKIGDFGLARTFRTKATDFDPLVQHATDSVGDGSSSSGGPPVLPESFTDYVVTRWYRPPELLLMNRLYTEAVDIWSVGCIFAELIRRKPLFPGKDYITQLNLIIDAIGIPDEEEVAAAIQSADARTFLRSMGAKTAKPIEELVSGLEADPQGVDFWMSMMQFLPSKRLTASELLRHPYLAPLHDPSDEPVAPRAYQWAHEGDVPTDQLRELFWAEQTTGSTK